MKTTSHEELLNEIIGAKGTDERKAYEQEVKERIGFYNKNKTI